MLNNINGTNRTNKTKRGLLFFHKCIVNLFAKVKMCLLSIATGLSLWQLNIIKLALAQLINHSLSPTPQSSF